MKALKLLVILFLFTFSFCQTPLVDINEIIKTATNYANSISCEVGGINSNNVVSLVPYTTIDNMYDAKYAVLCDMDVGCGGGTGSRKTSLIIVNIGMAENYCVNPSESSPTIEFSDNFPSFGGLPMRYIDKIISNTHNSITLTGNSYSAEDANCCPTIPVTFTMQSDKYGNWVIVAK